MAAYSQLMDNEELGMWLERVLHVNNHQRSDSVKIAIMFLDWNFVK